ncbi:DNA mismatch repair endonuclease MutL [Phocaeicola oris]|uniref:DNA mismatch repair endonuclease MutL n=1 Tax=Phocaeicola oris TaxID=2896850 RepID=UPI00234F8CE3|nr:DNA mismatch repair endonuclease MutL [Phocaeicola oris]MCE2615500.1 DNA mismatch repair endonuclease MutL [Phocaeicola oris]
MSDVIRVLPDSVANQIAAGEVIQRPASVIKELMENSIDAGAMHIDVVITDAGKTSIQVIDDGKGMSDTDARIAFERHATSKIRQASDLFALHTMGFRGEALASIAAVAQVELRTRTADEELGTSIQISGSKFESQEAIACPKGSNFIIKNLFFNIPARRKFLKSNHTELNNILVEFERVVLVNPTVSFTLYHNDIELYNLPASSLRQRIIGVFGKKMDQDLLDLKLDTTMVKLSGYVGRPESSRKRGVRQYFFVNGRYMRHPYFNKAVMSAYEKLLPADEEVPYFIYFNVDPANIDVNIHPTKTEIKFENEPAIWQILSAVVKETLGKFNEVPSIDFDTEDMPDIPVYEPSKLEGVKPPKVSIDPSYNPFRDNSYAQQQKNLNRWQELYKGLEGQNDLMPETNYSGKEEEPTLYDDQNVLQTGTVHYQYKGQYILTSVKSGLMIIDQQRAHIRILYDQYIRQIKTQKGNSQGLLFPEMVQFPISDLPIVQEEMSDLEYLGFELADLGNGSYSINGVPVNIDGLNPATLLQNMIQTAKDKSGKVKESIQSTLALSLAKAASIVPGQVLSNEEMNNLVEQLLSLSTPNYTPDGKTVLYVLRDDELNKYFK